MMICIRPFTKARESPIQYQEDSKKGVFTFIKCKNGRQNNLNLGSVNSIWKHDRDYSNTDLQTTF